LVRNEAFGCKNADAINALHEMVESLRKQIKALWQKKDEALETEIEAKYIRRDVDKLIADQEHQRRKKDG
jgi:hypothetical protein